MFFDGRCQRTEAYSRQILRKGAAFVGAGILLRRHMACMACSGACRENASDNKAKKTNHVRVPSPGRLRSLAILYASPDLGSQAFTRFASRCGTIGNI